MAYLSLANVSAKSAQESATARKTTHKGTNKEQTKGTQLVYLFVINTFKDIHATV